jgi:hypothetical protein
MTDKNRKSEQETGAAFALALVLQNILILIVLIGCFWALQHLIIEQGGSLNIIMRGGFLQ